MHQIITDNKDKIAKICRKYDIARLEIFGSAARGSDFDPVKSDADFLVEYNPPLLPGLYTRYFNMMQELESVLGTNVDLIRMGTIRNPYRMASINKDRELVYEE